MCTGTLNVERTFCKNVLSKYVLTQNRATFLMAQCRLTYRLRDDKQSRSQ
jgi:hypothetical protein